MTIDHRKQLDTLILKEINVKNFGRRIASTSKGELILNFDGNEYALMLGGHFVNIPNLLKKILDNLCS